jgi:hypothetical protein
MTEIDQPPVRDYAAAWRPALIAWGLPIAALMLSGGLDPRPKAIVWALALTWMGAACLVNARRCGRMHCFFTGPFFLVMAVAALLHGFEIVWLGPDGWRWLGAALIGGAVLLWTGSEKIWGRYTKR